MPKKELSTTGRIMLGLLLSIGGGTLLVLAFPPYEIWPLALVWFVPPLVSRHRVMPAGISSLGTALAIAVWLQGYLGPVFAPIGTYMVWLPLIVLPFAFFMDRGSRRFHSATGYRWFVPSGVLTWAGIEMIRLFLPIAGTWAFIAYPFYRQTWLIQPTALFGIIGTGMLVMLVNHVLALLVIGWLDGRRSTSVAAESTERGPQKNLPFRWALASGLILTAWITFSLILWNNPIETPTVKVAAVQPADSPAWIIARGEDPGPVHDRMLKQTREAAKLGASFIVWPEAAIGRDPQVEDHLNLTALTKETGIYLAVGYLVRVEGKGIRNEATVIDPEGQFLGVFGKDHPVLFVGETSLTRGTYPVYDTAVGNVATIICYDLDYTDTSRKMAARGAQLIGAPSNDWSSIAEKHYAHAVFRAIENRIAIVKADGGYNSAIIDPYGRITDLVVTPEGGEATLVADVQIGDGRGTPYTRLGDWAGWVALAGMVFFATGKKHLQMSRGRSC